MQKLIDILNPIAKAIVGAAMPLLITGVQDLVSSGADWTLALAMSVITGLAVWAKPNIYS